MGFGFGNWRVRHGGFESLRQRRRFEPERPGSAFEHHPPAASDQVQAVRPAWIRSFGSVGDAIQNRPDVNPQFANASGRGLIAFAIAARGKRGGETRTETRDRRSISGFPCTKCAKLPWRGPPVLLRRLSSRRLLASTAPAAPHRRQVSPGYHRGGSPLSWKYPCANPKS